MCQSEFAPNDSCHDTGWHQRFYSVSSARTFCKRQPIAWHWNAMPLIPSKPGVQNEIWRDLKISKNLQVKSPFFLWFCKGITSTCLLMGPLFGFQNPEHWEMKFISPKVTKAYLCVWLSQRWTHSPNPNGVSVQNTFCLITAIVTSPFVQISHE